MISILFASNKIARAVPTMSTGISQELEDGLDFGDDEGEELMQCDY